MVLNPQFMGKLRNLLATAAGGLALAGCAEAGAEDKNKAPETAEFTRLAAVVETIKVTRDQCIALMPDKAEVKACMVKLSQQNKAEIAAKTVRKAEQVETIATKTEILETEKDKNDLRHTTVEGLSKVVALQEEPNR